MAPRTKPPLDPRTLTPQQLLAIVAIIQELLWLRDDGQWDPDKEWKGDYIEEVANTLIVFGLRPA